MFYVILKFDFLFIYIVDIKSKLVSVEKRVKRIVEVMKFIMIGRLIG